MSRIFERIFSRPAEELNRTAIISGEVTLSYARLGRHVSAAARQLHAEGIARGQLVALDAPNEAWHIIFSLALEQLGAVHFTTPATEIDGLEAALGLRFDAVIQAHGQQPSVRVQPGSNAGMDGFLMLASSGTTGRRKLSILDTDRLLARFDGDTRSLPFLPSDVYRSLVRVTFSVAKQRALFALMAGATVCLDEPVSDSAGRVEHLRRHRVSYLSGIPSHALALAAAARPGNRLPDLRVLRIGSSLVPERTRALVRERLTPNLHVNYGTNETGTVCIATPEDLLAVPGTVGRPSPALRVEVVDEIGNPMPPGQAGTVRISGAPVISRYLSPKEANANAFRDGWFLPGDLASTTHDGRLVFHGRRDDMMIFDGVNVFPIEIEQALLGFPGVEEAYAFALPSERYLHVPAAIVAGSADLDLEAMDRHAKRVLGHTHPKLLYLTDSIPKNAMGKPYREGVLACLNGCRRVFGAHRERS